MQIHTYFQNFRVLSLFCIFMQTCGIGLFNGQGWLFTFLVIILNIKNIHLLKDISLWKLSIVICFFVIVMLIKDTDLQWILYMCTVFFSTILFLANYLKRKDCFILDFYNLLKLFYLYSIISIIVLLLCKPLLIDADVTNGIRPKTFLYLFFYNIQSSGTYRIQGLAWEPGNWQLFLNFFFLFSVLLKAKTRTLLFVSVCIIFTHSTNGYILLVLNWFYYFYKSKNRHKIAIYIGFLSVISFPIVIDNIQEKLVGEKSISGLARIRDVAVGTELIRKNPFLGVNPNDINEMSFVRKIKMNLYYEHTGNINRINNDSSYDAFERDGFLNGFLQVFLDWGVIGGFFIYILFIRSPLLGGINKMLPFSIIFFLSLFSEPISRTIFFYLFPFSTLIIKK